MVDKMIRSFSTTSLSNSSKLRKTALFSSSLRAFKVINSQKAEIDVTLNLEKGSQYALPILRSEKQAQSQVKIFSA